MVESKKERTVQEHLTDTVKAATEMFQQTDQMRQIDARIRQREIAENLAAQAKLIGEQEPSE